jgi:hypothetical protein
MMRRERLSLLSRPRLSLFARSNFVEDNSTLREQKAESSRKKDNQQGWTTDCQDKQNTMRHAGFHYFIKR